jgi:predicted nucleotidyltransferase
VFDELRGLAAKTFGLAEALQEFLRPLRRKVAAAFVYGSQAGGKARAASDVDLMVIGKATFGEVVAALQPAHDRLGREVNPTVYPEAEFRAKLAKKHHFLRAVMDGPKIFLVGDERVLKGLAEKCPYCAPKHGPRIIGGTAPR